LIAASLISPVDERYFCSTCSMSREISPTPVASKAILATPARDPPPSGIYAASSSSGIG